VLYAVVVSPLVVEFATVVVAPAVVELVTVVVVAAVELTVVVVVLDALATETVVAPLAVDSTLAISSDIEELDRVELIPERETLRFTTTEAVWFNAESIDAEAVADEVALADEERAGVPDAAGSDVAISVGAALAVSAEEAPGVAVDACVRDACAVALEDAIPVAVLGAVALTHADADPLGCSEGVDRSDTVVVMIVDAVTTAETEGVAATVGDGVRTAEAELPADSDAALVRVGSDVAEVVSLWLRNVIVGSDVGLGSGSVDSVGAAVFDLTAVAECRRTLIVCDVVALTE
jgi:hypothetical protein